MIIEWTYESGWIKILNFFKSKSKILWASIISKTLFIIVAESTDIFFPIFQLGCLIAEETLIFLNSDNGKFTIISHGVGKYGRVLGELFVKGHEKSVNQLLLENGHAYEYEGGKKKVFGG